MWKTNLVKLYCAVCDNCSAIEAVMQRQNNNFRPQFSDEECITFFLWGISQRRFEQKTIHNYTKNHLLDWFPKLPSYAAFSRRLNAISPAFQALAELWLNSVADGACEEAAYIVDSCPMTLTMSPRSGHAEVAAELCEKSYNSSRDEWYYGIKLHTFVSRHTGYLPTLLFLMVSGSALHDLTAAKQIIEDGLP